LEIPLADRPRQGHFCLHPYINDVGLIYAPCLNYAKH
jgi:hypothetical protein